MRKVVSLLASVLLVVPLVAALTAPAAQAASASPGTQPLVLVHDLNWPDVDQQSTASAVNASGQVTGASNADGGVAFPGLEGHFGYVSDASNSSATLLQALIGPGGEAETPQSFANALNGSGMASGASNLAVPFAGGNGPTVAAVWDTSGNATALGTIGNRTCVPIDPENIPCDNSQANGINNTGTAVGVSDRDDGSGGRIHHAFADTLDTLTMTDLGTLAGGANSDALGVNDAGTVVGSSETTDGGGLTTHAFTDDLSTHTMTDIGTLAGGSVSSATAINSHGLVVGSSAVTGGATHPFTYDIASHTLTDLGLPPGATSADATAVNDDGLVVGDSDAGPWVHDPTAGTFIMITGAATATGINDSGEIVGVGQVPDALDPTTTLLTGAYRTFVELVAPNAPTNAHIATACGSAPTLRWSASKPKSYGPADAYVVFRNGVMIAKVTGTAYTDRSAIAPATYTVAASNLAGLSPMSNGVAWTCLPGITGAVTADGTPIGGVDVRVYDAGTTVLAAKAQTDPGGHFGVPGLAPGSYNVRFSDAAGRVVLAWNGGATTQATAAPVVVGGGVATTVDVDLVSAGAISGTVSSSGGPDAGQVVRVYSAGVAPSMAKTTTAADGTYTVSGLAPGSYQVLVEDPANAFVPVWNGGAANQATALPLTITAGATTTVDLTQHAAAQITGTVTGDSSPQGGIAVRVYATGTATLAAKTVTAADGTYSLATLAAGAGYQVRFSDPTNHLALQWAVGATTQSHATTFTLTAGAPTVVDAMLVDAPV
jgi:probable HAF family extracellular repeat protein